MFLSDNLKLITYEGIQHSIPDLKRRYEHSVLELYDSSTQEKGIFKVNNIDGAEVECIKFTNGKWGLRHLKSLQYLYITREYPPCGLVQVGKNIILLTRKSNRQWRRGANDHTMQIETLHSDENKKSFPGTDTIYAFAFSQERMNKEQFTRYLAHEDITNPKVVTDSLWIKSRDNYLISIYFQDLFVGMCDKECKYIPCKETATLVEETLYELGLQPI